MSRFQKTSRERDPHPKQTKSYVTAKKRTPAPQQHIRTALGTKSTMASHLGIKKHRMNGCQLPVSSGKLRALQLLQQLLFAVAMQLCIFSAHDVRRCLAIIKEHVAHNRRGRPVPKNGSWQPCRSALQVNNRPAKSVLQRQNADVHARYRSKSLPQLPFRVLANIETRSRSSFCRSVIAYGCFLRTSYETSLWQVGSKQSAGINFARTIRPWKSILSVAWLWTAFEVISEL